MTEADAVKALEEIGPIAAWRARENLPPISIEEGWQAGADAGDPDRWGWIALSNVVIGSGAEAATSGFGHTQAEALDELLANMRLLAARA